MNDGGKHSDGRVAGNHPRLRRHPSRIRRGRTFSEELPSLDEEGWRVQRRGGAERVVQRKGGGEGLVVKGILKNGYC